MNLNFASEAEDYEEPLSMSGRNKEHRGILQEKIRKPRPRHGHDRPRNLWAVWKAAGISSQPLQSHLGLSDQTNITGCILEDA